MTEESFLENKFGKLEYAALAKEQKNYGVYITDFFADACIVNHPGQSRSYESMVGRTTQYTGYCYGYINGVIQTNYKERHRDILEKLSDPTLSRDEFKKLTQSDECLAFYDEISQFLNVAYSFDPDFVEHVITSGGKQFVSTGISTFEFGGKAFECKESWFSSADFKNTVPLGDNEVLMNYDLYNEIFGTSYTSQTMNQFVAHEVKFSYYLMCDQSKSQKKYSATIKIIGLNNNTANFNVADNLLKDLQRAEMFAFGLYFDDEAQTELLVNVADENGFVPYSSIAGSIATMTKAVGVFSNFFNLIFIVLCVALLLLMVQFELKNIKDKMKDIGVLNALGAKDGNLFVIFGGGRARGGACNGGFVYHRLVRVHRARQQSARAVPQRTCKQHNGDGPCLPLREMEIHLAELPLVARHPRAFLPRAHDPSAIHQTHQRHKSERIKSFF